MKSSREIEKLLGNKFESKRVKAVTEYFLLATEKLQQGDWESSLAKAGKFIEAIVKMLWVHAGKSLPAKQKDFKAGVYAQNIINLNASILPNDGLRVQIPRASIFVYDITSNRGARHDSEEVNANEMDATTVLPVCAWILSELVRFSAKESMTVDDAKKFIDSLIERRYPIFEEIDDRIYVDNKKFKSAPECALLILYKIYPRRISRDTLGKLMKIHGFKKTALKFERLQSYIDVDDKGDILLRATGRKEAEEILNKR